MTIDWSGIIAIVLTLIGSAVSSAIWITRAVAAVGDRLQQLEVTIARDYARAVELEVLRQRHDAIVERVVRIETRVQIHPQGE